MGQAFLHFNQICGLKCKPKQYSLIPKKKKIKISFISDYPINQKGFFLCRKKIKPKKIKKIWDEIINIVQLKFLIANSTQLKFCKNFIYIYEIMDPHIKLHMLNTVFFCMHIKLLIII